MTMPTFIGIGAPRSGSTWLHKLLDSHPAIYMPQKQKEIGYFSRRYERGLDWYDSFFPTSDAAQAYGAIGEITPTYLYLPKVPERIAAMPSVSQLLLILRNPVDRAYSHFAQQKRDGQFTEGFDTFLSAVPNGLRRGEYAHYLARFLPFFSPEQMLILVMESAVSNPKNTQQQLAQFLDVDPAGFAPLPDVVNESYQLKRAGVQRHAVRFGRWLRKHDLHALPNIVARAGGKRIVGGKSGRFPPMPTEIRTQLDAHYQPHNQRLAQTFGVDITPWQSTAE